MSSDGSGPQAGSEAVAVAPWHRAPMLAAILYCVCMVAFALVLLLWPFG